MRISLAILAAAVVGFGGATLNSAPASAVTLTPLVHEGAAGNQMETIQVGHRWHRGHHWGGRDRTGRAIGYGLLGFGAGLALSQLTQPRYHTYGYPHHHTYGGHPQYRVYGGGSPYWAPQGEAGTSVDNRDPIHRP